MSLLLGLILVVDIVQLLHQRSASVRISRSIPWECIEFGLVRHGICAILSVHSPLSLYERSKSSPCLVPDNNPCGLQNFDEASGWDYGIWCGP